MSFWSSLPLETNQNVIYRRSNLISSIPKTDKNGRGASIGGGPVLEEIRYMGFEFGFYSMATMFRPVWNTVRDMRIRGGAILKSTK